MARYDLLYRVFVCDCGLQYRDEEVEVLLKPSEVCNRLVEAHCPCGVLLSRRLAPDRKAGETGFCGRTLSLE